MQIDESGAPWPYERVEPPDLDPGVPRWDCPSGQCQCHAPTGEAERVQHKILFFDPEAKKMKDARCRVIEDGELINKQQPYADGGAVTVRVRPSTRVLELEWAPASLPQGPGYPYRKQYYLDLGDGPGQGVERRLHNIGFSAQDTREANIKDFQRTYRNPVTGAVHDVEVELASYHDDGTLPPIPPQNDANDAVAAKPPAAPAPPGGVAGGLKKQGSVTAVQMTKLRIRVRTRAGRGIDGATVTLDVGGKSPSKETDQGGFATFTLTKDEVDAAKPPGEIIVRAKKFHHGPEPRGAQKVTAGELAVTAQVAPPGWSESQPDISLLDPSTPGLKVDARGTYLDLVLRDACMNRGETSSTITRRLSTDELLKELIYDHISGAVMLTADTEFQFDHDHGTGEFDPCTSNCKLKSPKQDHWVSLQTNKIADVTWLMLVDPFVPGTRQTGDADNSQVFLRDKFHWQRNYAGFSNLDQRHVVGLVRLSKQLATSFGIVAVYNQGIEGNSAGTNTHAWGMAADFGGGSTRLPDRYQPASTRQGPLPQSVRLGVDFIVFFHWGLWSHVPMWDPTTVAANPKNDPNLQKWDRYPTNGRDDGYNYASDPAKKKLHYRLDPAPYQDPPVADDVPAHFVTARALFQAVYEWAVKEYSDDNDILGPRPGVTETPTPIDSVLGHRTIFPDYPQPDHGKGKNGRQAHVNHLHFQLGPTEHGVARTK